MENIEEALFQDCVAYIELRPVEISSADMLTLYEFVEAYSLKGIAEPRIAQKAKEVINKYPEFTVKL